MDSALDNRTHIFVGDLPQARLLTAGYCECVEMVRSGLEMEMFAWTMVLGDGGSLLQRCFSWPRQIRNIDWIIFCESIIEMRQSSLD